MTTTQNQTLKLRWAEGFKKPIAGYSNVQTRQHLITTPLIRLNHISHITYAIPLERVRPIVPANFELITRNIENDEFALLTVESFLDQGSQAFDALSIQARRDAFEQTNYRIHVRLNGQRCGWLIGSSLGSLSAVAARHLWSAPWHLGAMEFQVAYDAINERYQHYRLRTQSQWANAFWELSDSGKPISDEFSSKATSEPAMPDYFIRRDGSLGLHKVMHEASLTTCAEILSARCDLLERLGLLTAEELRRPLAVTLERAVNCRIDCLAKADIASAA
ncbi:MAG TPA: DUF2071 domain-containing protein [Blastocatellia bacterium]|nr:DUF2071 domain-containing protein [Blastocatellia bacterium]